MSLRELKYLYEDIERRPTHGPLRYDLRRTVSKEDDVPTPVANGVTITQKRKSELERDSENFKRVKDAAASIVKTYTCPLTGVILSNPVMIEGEFVILYERKALIEYINRKGIAPDGCISSPITKKPVLPTLIPAHQARSAIFHLVASGILDRYLTTEWKDVMNMKRKADGGDSGSMVNLAYWFCDPENNDSHCPSADEEQQAFLLWKRAADLGNAEGMAEAGECLVEGCGVEQDALLGIELIENAARNGFANARLSLALDYDMGLSGLKMDKDSAKYWAQKALDDSCSWPLDENERDIAQRLLQELRTCS